MSNIDVFLIVDILGTIAFAISGALAAIRKRMDFFGVLIIAFVTSVGGGTIRDLLIGDTPVTWIRSLTSSYVIFFSAMAAIIFRNKLKILRTSLFLFDTIGIGLFTIIGIEKGLMFHLHPFVCIALGTVSACFGGVLRDILCNEIPVLFRKEIYATACISGGIIFFILRHFSVNQDIIYLLTAGTVISIRLMAVIKSWSFPKVEMNTKK
ncbi:trimeric intracellular cation channel family protein [Avrilella dinanensis]|uniref:trimeric intracellular cation channel family protein n=1 Tax=Avrilella dinanensis TaxID=2008672 RepID=UPI0024090734|nr:trimeric intracellular cation channel family protein [Avrilella dinanensis]